MPPTVAVIILTLNQRDKTLTCLSTLTEQQGATFQVLVWDNGSDDDTVEAIRAAYPDVLAHHHHKNLGVAGGRNEAARLAIHTFNPSHLLFLDNDIEVEPGFIAALLGPFLKDERVGQTQAKLRFLYDRERLNDGGGCNINFLLGSTRPVGYGEIDQGQHDQMKPCVACGGAMMVRTDVFQELEGFDMRFNPFGPEDIDFSLRLSKAGYLALYVPDALAYHEVSHTFGGGYSDVYAQHKTRHWFLLMRRHAPFWKRAVFVGITAPFLLVKVLLREALRGNFTVFKGLFRGARDALSAQTKR